MSGSLALTKYPAGAPQREQVGEFAGTGLLK